jgi:hypothetical protein
MYDPDFPRKCDDAARAGRRRRPRTTRAQSTTPIPNRRSAQTPKAAKKARSTRRLDRKNAWRSMPESETCSGNLLSSSSMCKQLNDNCCQIFFSMAERPDAHFGIRGRGKGRDAELKGIDHRYA